MLGPAVVASRAAAGERQAVGQRAAEEAILAMSGPNFVRYIGPVLAALKRLGGSGRPTEVREIVAEILSLPDSVLDEQSAGGNNRYDNQVAW